MSALEQRIRDAETRLHAAETLRRRSRAKRLAGDGPATPAPWDDLMAPPTEAELDRMLLTPGDLDAMTYKPPG